MSYKCASFLVYIVLFLLGATVRDDSPSSNSAEQSLTVEQLREDFLVVRGSILEAHPGLYRFTDRRVVHAYFDEAWSELDRPMTELELFRILSPVNGVIKCGHTKMLPSRKKMTQTIQEGRLLPFQCIVIDDRLYVRENQSLLDDLTKGSEILAINDTPVASLIDRMLPSLWADGEIDIARRQMLAADFKVWYAWLIDTPDRFNVSIRQPDGAERLLELEALTLETMASQVQRRAGEIAGTEETDDPPGELELLAEYKAAVLTVRSLFNPHFERAGMIFADFLRDSFNVIELEGVEQLIIDVRGNGGGNDINGKLLVSHLIGQPVRFYRSVAPVTRIFPFTKFTPVDPEEMEEIFAPFTLTDEGGYEWPENEKLAFMDPASTVFAGRVIVLIDTGSFSGAAEFATLLRHHGRAEFVGQETGGAFVGNNSGAATDIILPNSGIIFHMPFYRYEMDVDISKNPRRGVLPDVEVIPTIEDLLAERDVAMEQALKLLRSR